MAEVVKDSFTTEQAINDQRKKVIAEALYRQAVLTGKNLSTVKPVPQSMLPAGGPSLLL